MVTMSEKEKKSILIVAGNTEMLKSMRATFDENDVKVYLSRSVYYATEILLTKQVDAVFIFAGFAHVIEAFRLFSTIPCTYIVCGNCLRPGAVDFSIHINDFKIEEMPQYFNQMIRLNDLRTRFRGVVWFSKLRIDIDNYTVEYEDKSFKLKPLEIKLLFYLSKHLNRVISRNRLLLTVWGYEESGATRTLDVHIMSLRALLNNNSIPLEIQTFRGEGYKLFDTETMGGMKYFI